MANDDVSYVRSLVFISISGYLLVRAYTGLERVNNKDIGITVDTFAENDLRTFPLITFCPLMKDVIQLVDEETTFQQVLDQSPTRDLIILPKADEPMLVGKWTKTFKFFSHPKYGSRRLVQACFTYDHGKNVKVGSYEDHLTFVLQMRDVEEILLTVHDQFGYINTHYNLDGRKTPIIEWLNPNKYRVLKFDVEPQMYKKLEIEKNGKVEDVCTLDADPECLEHVIERELGCSTPWSFNSSSNSVYPPCRSAVDLQRIVGLIPDQRKTTPSKLRYYLKEKKCPLPCEFIFYEPRIVYDLIDDAVSDQLDRPAFHEVELVVNLWNGERKITEEVLVFDMGAFIGDIGGYVGLLLGYCLLSLFDSVHGYAMDIYKLCRKQKLVSNSKQQGKLRRRKAIPEEP